MKDITEEMKKDITKYSVELLRKLHNGEITEVELVQKSIAFGIILTQRIMQEVTT
jgi:3-methyladenine DNA glycosylase AlkD